MDYKKILPHVIAIAVFLTLLFFMFRPQFAGKSIEQGDIRNYRGQVAEMNKYQELKGDRVNWTNSSFGGMPTYQVKKLQEGNLLLYVRSAMNAYLGRPAGIFFSGFVAMYIFFLALRLNPWLSMLGSIAATLTINNYVLYVAGHNSKIEVIMYLPMIAAGIVMVWQRKYLLGSVVFALGLGLAVLENHPQMLYYFAMTIGLFGFYWVYDTFKKKTWLHLAKSAGVLLLAALIALGAGATNILPNQEFVDQTIRGNDVLSNNPWETDQTAVDQQDSYDSGLDWGYAMAWSNDGIDVLASYVPMAAGGRSSQAVSLDSPIGQALRRLGVRPPGKTIDLPLYYGDMAFTEGPIYLGAVLTALFILGLFTAPIWARIWFGGGVLMITLISLGYNFEAFNRFLFENLPLFNKFRTPNSAMSICNVLMAALGIYGLHSWYYDRARTREQRGKQLIYAAAISVFPLLLSIFIIPGMVDYSGIRDAQTFQQVSQDPNVIEGLLRAMEKTRQELFVDSAWRSLLLVGLTFAVLYLIWRKTVNLAVATAALAALVLFDVVPLNRQYLTYDDFVRTRVIKDAFDITPADQAILADPDPNFRVFNVTARLDQDARTSYFHKSLGGYSAAKLRRYQDIIMGHLNYQNQAVIDMLNTKYYLVNNGNGGLQARPNPGAYGSAWLASNIQMVPDADAEFAALSSNTDLKSNAIIHQEFAEEVAGLQPTGSGQIEHTSYHPEELRYEVTANGDQLAVFSEIWYGPDLGWKAYIDGEPTDLIRANYILRAVRVPAGTHEIVLKFEPEAYFTGKAIALVCSGLILIGLLAVLVIEFVRRTGVDNTATPTAQVS